MKFYVLHIPIEVAEAGMRYPATVRVDMSVSDQTTPQEAADLFVSKLRDSLNTVDLGDDE